MSICAITAGDQDCEAEIKWLSQSLLLDETQDAFCLLELIAHSKRGNLRYVDLYFPYITNDFENRTATFLHKANYDIYKGDPDVFQIIYINPNNPKCGEIILDSHKAQVANLSLNDAQTPIGTKLTIDFLQPVPALQSRIARIIFDARNLVQSTPEGQHIIALKYYDTQHANFLKLKTALYVNDLFVWLLFPYPVMSIKETPLFTIQSPLRSPMLDESKALYGPRIIPFYRNLPKRSAMWRNDPLYNRPALKPWTSFPPFCEYTLHKPQTDKKPTVPQKDTPQLKYPLYVPRRSGDGCKIIRRLSPSELEEECDQLKQKYLLLLDQRFNSLYLNGNKIPEVTIPIPLIHNETKGKTVRINATFFNLLFYFLKLKGGTLQHDVIYMLAWFHKWKGKDELPERYKGTLRTAISTLRAILKALGLDQLQIKAKRHEGYSLEGKCDYCLIADIDDIG